MKTFAMGGVHPEENKISTTAVIEEFPLPKTAVILMNQHLGAPATPCVEKGDKVKVGQLIGKAEAFMCANIHSPFSGTVAKIDTCKDAFGLTKPAIYINVEGDEWEESIDRTPDIKRECTLESKEIVDKLKAMGVVGLGGATFPTHIKYSIAPDKKAEYLIINAVECEPYLTSDHRVMMEHAEEICIGVSILRKALGVPNAYIGIENNKPEPIAVMKAMAAKFEGIIVEPLKVNTLKVPKNSLSTPSLAVASLRANCLSMSDALSAMSVPHTLSTKQYRKTNLLSRTSLPLPARSCKRSITITSVSVSHTTTSSNIPSLNFQKPQEKLSVAVQ